MSKSLDQWIDDEKLTDWDTGMIVVRGKRYMLVAIPQDKWKDRLADVMRGYQEHLARALKKEH